jgi:hypothetical protein
MTTLSRDEILIRAAKVKAAIVGACNSGSKRLLEFAELSEVKEYNLTIAQVQSYVAQCKSAKLIHSISDPERAGGALYIVRSESEELEVKRPYNKREQPTLKVDLIKATGRVRLEINGFVIEIGVV